MRWGNIKDTFGLKRPSIQAAAKEIEPRTLSEREASWVRDILQVNREWRDADITKTKVVAEGPKAEGYSIVLQAASPENPVSKSSGEVVGQLWIQADDESTINVQLFQLRGSLREIYVLCMDRKGRNRKLPETWTEASREAVSG